MGRPRQYDPDAALDAAQQAFWSRGYTATSVTDLCEATGMKKGSLYQAFGDKRALFFAVLDRYLQGGAAGLEALRATPADAALATLEGWLRMATTGACSGAGPGGCMAVNALVELGPHDGEVRARLDRHFVGMRDALTELIARGQAAGTLRAGRDPADLARYLEVLVSGLTTAGRGGDAAGALPVIEAALDALRPV